MSGISSATSARTSIELGRMTTLTCAIQRDQSAVSSGRAVAAGSDDPAAATRLDRLSSARADSAAWTDNLALIDRWAAQRDGSLGTATAIFDRARELVSAGLSGTASTEARAAAAAELTQLAAALRELSVSETIFVPGTTGTLAIPTGPSSSVALPVDLSTTLPSPELLDQAAAALRIDGPAARAAQGATVIAALTNATNQVIEARALTGSIASAAAARSDSLTTQDTLLAEEQAALGETDIAAAIARIQTHQLTLDAAQALFARINRSTLFDLLR